MCLCEFVVCVCDLHVSRIVIDRWVELGKICVFSAHKYSNHVYIYLYRVTFAFLEGN